MEIYRSLLWWPSYVATLIRMRPAPDSYSFSRAKPPQRRKHKKSIGSPRISWHLMSALSALVRHSIPRRTVSVKHTTHSLKFSMNRFTVFMRTALQIIHSKLLYAINFPHGLRYGFFRFEQFFVHFKWHRSAQLVANCVETAKYFSANFGMAFDCGASWATTTWRHLNAMALHR